MAKRELTAFEYLTAAIMGVYDVEATRVKAGRHTLDMNRTYFEDDNTRSFAVRVNGKPLAVVWPSRGLAEVFADYRLMADYSIDMQVKYALKKAGYINSGHEHHSDLVDGDAQTWTRKPPMYLVTTDDGYPRSVDGMYTYDPTGMSWSYYCSAVIPGENGHQCTPYIPERKEGYKIWAVEYMGAHEYAEFGEFGYLHSFGAVKLLHEVRGREPIRGTIMDAGMWREGIFSIDEEPSFPGMTWGQTWNGAACPYFTKEVAEEVIAWALSTREDKEISEDHEENYDLVMPDPVKTPYGDLYPVGAWIWTWYEER